MIKMDHDMLHLARRLVIAMETMSQDVKNMSAYVYDISRSVSYLVNEKRQKEYIPVVGHGEFENPPSATSAAGQVASDEGEYSEPYEQENERSLWPIGDPKLGESSFGVMASTSTDHHENTDVLTSESHPIFWNEVNAETQSLSDSQDEVYGMSADNSPEELPPPSNLLKILELPSNDVCQEIQRMENSSNSTVNCDYATHMDIIQGGKARTHQMKSAEDASVIYTVVDTEETPHKCSVCEKSFKALSQLKRHTRVHSGERPYKCNVCLKAFTQRSHLSIHMRCHTGEKPYRCDVCGNSFTVKTTLQAHMRTHTGDKPFKCTVCGKPFRQRIVLTRHMSTHPADDPL